MQRGKYYIVDNYSSSIIAVREYYVTKSCVTQLLHRGRVTRIGALPLLMNDLCDAQRGNVVLAHRNK